MGEVVDAFGGATGGRFHEILWKEGGTFGMDFALEPLEEGGGVGLGECAGDGGVFQGALEELGGVEVAEGVGDEVTESAHRPVDVLQAAFGVGGRSHAEEFLEEAVPSLGDVFGLQLPANELAFESEAEEDV